MFHFQHCNNQNKSSSKRYLDAAWVGHGHLVHIIRLAIFARVQAHRVHAVVQLLLIWRKTSFFEGNIIHRWDRWAFLRFEAEVGTFWRGKKRYVTRGGANWPCLAIAIEFDIDRYIIFACHTPHTVGWVSYKRPPEHSVSYTAPPRPPPSDVAAPDVVDQDDLKW